MPPHRDHSRIEGERADDLAYAIAHPATVQTLILRGVFLCRRADVDYFFQGNAAQFATDPLVMPVPGAYHDFPTAWRHFVDAIPPEDRGDVVKGAGQDILRAAAD